MSDIFMEYSVLGNFKRGTYPIKFVEVLQQLQKEAKENMQYYRTELGSNSVSASYWHGQYHALSRVLSHITGDEK
jgi:hypothetical protein